MSVTQLTASEVALFSLRNAVEAERDAESEYKRLSGEAASAGHRAQDAKTRKANATSLLHHALACQDPACADCTRIVAAWDREIGAMR